MKCKLCEKQFITEKGLVKFCSLYCKQKNNSSKKTNHIIKHGLYKHPLYTVYHNMIKRCYKKYNSEYYNYGKRGIRVCREWKKEFIVFYNWAINNGYKKGLYIDRIDFNGNYEPKNCRFVDKNTSCSNRRKVYPINKIREDLKTMKRKDIAKKYKCSLSWINTIARNKNLKD